MSENVASLFGLRWKKLVADRGEWEWEAWTRRHRYLICQTGDRFVVARYLAAPTSGKRYPRYIRNPNHPYPATLEELKASFDHPTLEDAMAAAEEAADLR
jgi:hypothetical protein